MPSTKPTTYYQGRLLVWPLLSLLPPGHSVCLLDTSLCFWLPIDSDVHALAFSLSGCAASTSSSGLLSNQLDTACVVTVIPSGLVFSLSNICSTLNGSIYLLSSFRKAWVRGVQYYPCPCSWKKKHVVHPRFLPSELVSSFHKEDT